MQEELGLMFRKILESAETNDIVVVASAGNKVGTITLTRRSTLYELTI